MLEVNGFSPGGPPKVSAGKYPYLTNDLSGIVSEQKRKYLFMARENLAAVILAAGESKRMNRQPKAAIILAGRPLALWVLQALAPLKAEKCLAVVGHEAEKVKAAFGDSCGFVIQGLPRGTGHALLSCEKALTDYRGDALVVSVDHPLLASEDLLRLVAHHRASRAEASLLSLLRENPSSYGRIVRDAAGKVVRIVEERDASPEEKKIQETNLGIYCFALPGIFEVLKRVGTNNAQQEQYLTDAVGIMVEQGRPVEALASLHEETGFGINTPEELARAEALLNEKTSPG
jgi:bifunctional UDP-N-acetylglucosamine pyrophosphorylase / glucosamine-1-phosphate N-acetyltransferase